MSVISILVHIKYYNLYPAEMTKSLGPFDYTLAKRLIFAYMVCPSYILPSYLATYAYIIGIQFNEFFNELKKCPKLFEKRDSVMERYNFYVDNHQGEQKLVRTKDDFSLDLEKIRESVTEGLRDLGDEFRKGECYGIGAS